jgi:hypothetical protein
MTLLDDLGLRESPLLRRRILAMTGFTSFTGGSDDPRWALLALVLRGAGMVGAFGQRQLAYWAGRFMRRAWRGARFAANTADTMVAAGGR